MTCQPLMFGFDAEYNGYVPRCACGWKGGPETFKADATRVLKWHLDDGSPTQRATHRLGIVLVRKLGTRTTHGMRWLADSTLCGVNVRNLRSQAHEEISCDKCLKILAGLVDTKV